MGEVKHFHCQSSDSSFALLRFMLQAIPPDELARLTPRVKRLARMDSTTGVTTVPTSLTDGVGPSGQIRFNLHRRTRRGLIEAAETIQGKFGSSPFLTICNVEDMDSGSAYFLGVAESIWAERSVRRIHCTERDCIGVTSDLARPEGIPHSELVELAWERLRVGDPWGCTILLEDSPPSERNARAHQALATAYVALDRPFEAEVHFLKWIEAGDALDSARGKYGLAMLLARFHVADRRDDSRAAHYLNSALGDLRMAREDSPSLDTTFEEVFNRNGFALLEFRAGRSDAALALLESGLERLPDSSPRNHLHRSVLLYNIAQVYRRVGEHEQAITMYQALLRLDPNMPEYHCEYALSLMAVGCLGKAIAEVKVALTLDPYVPESHALHGYLSMRAEEFQDALVHYRRACQLSPNFGNIYGYAYCANECGEYVTALEILAAAEGAHLSNHDRRNLASLNAEILVHLGKPRNALEGLMEALRMLPGDPVLMRNVEVARQLLVQRKPNAIANGPNQHTSTHYGKSDHAGGGVE